MTDSISKSIKEFWDNQAKEHGTDDKATAPDTAYRQLEIDRIIQHIRGQFILDVGCGNAYSTCKFAEACPSDWSFTGMDYSQDMIDEARRAVGASILFDLYVGSVLELNQALKYDTVISERCLINLLTWTEQRKAIMNMGEVLNPGGRIVLVENFREGLNNLNELRRVFDLHAISTRWHNRYLNYEEFINFINDHFKIVYSENIGNLYYIISRVVYAALAKQDGKEPEYANPINFIASKLPSLGNYNFSPNMLYVLEKK
jgi:ubiquinone/menaquinone biosynthesis C-methylase UbiE